MTCQQIGPVVYAGADLRITGVAAFKTCALSALRMNKHLQTLQSPA
jgi:hypothetical protein